MVMSKLSKNSLSASRRWLLVLMQQLNFGRIEGLTVKQGEPVGDPPPRVVREVKLGGENGPWPDAPAGDFLLKAQVVELFAYLDRLQNSTIEVLVVKHGLPFSMNVEDVAA